MNTQRRQLLKGLIAGLATSALGLPDALCAASTSPTWNARMPQVPDVKLLDHQGEKIALRPLLTQGPVAVNFFYTGCSSFCPPQTAIFRQLQELAAADCALRPHLVSISIDPLGDSPQAISSFAQRYEARLGASSRWWMLTGAADRTREMDEVLRAFDVHAASLADHPAQVWVGNASKARWMRSLGLASANDVHQWLRAAAA